LPPGAPDVPVETGPAPTKLVVKDLKEGTGPVIQPGATITATYIGVACSTGEIFDSSYAHGQAIQFPLTQVIPGWTNGIPGMKVGGVRLLGIPADQAYGPNPPPGSGIAPNEALWFVVQPVKLG
jgi:peptidylprolyl isomerase